LAQTSADSSKLSINTISIEEKLVQLALSGPLFKASESQSKINEYALKAAKNQWVNLLTLSANFNDQNAFTQNVTNATIFPRYFFGFNIPLGTLLSKTAVKSAKEQINITKSNRELLERSLRAEILTKYQRYKNYAELISIQNQIVDDEETAYLQAKEKFRNGLILIEIYNIAQRAYNNEITKKLNLQMEQDIVKIDIERIIGVSLDSVISK
jgi:outer membrane protein TolC